MSVYEYGPAVSPRRLEGIANAVNDANQRMMTRLHELGMHRSPASQDYVYMGGSGDQFLIQEGSVIHYSSARTSEQFSIDERGLLQKPPIPTSDHKITLGTGERSISITGFTHHTGRGFIWFRNGILVAVQGADGYHLWGSPPTDPRGCQLMRLVGSPVTWTRINQLPEEINPNWLSPQWLKRLCPES